MKPPKISKKIKTTIKIAVSVGFLSWIIWTTDWQEVSFYLKKINFWYLIAYVAILFTGFWISSYKWKLLANYKKIYFPHFYFFKLYFIGTFINNFMPSFIAGDAYKAYEIGEKKEAYSQAASTVMMDRITGLIGATILGILFALLNLSAVLKSKALIITSILLLVSLSVDLMMPKIRRIDFIRNFLSKFVPQKVITFIEEISEFSQNKKIITQSLYYSMLFSIVGVAILNYILFLALEIKISPLDYLSVIFITAIISALPISINNIGVKEWAYITFFGIFSINPAAVLTVAIISRTIQMAVSFLAFPLYLKNKK